jgi:GNAT superfamily N-acetyltransferase
MWRAKGVKIVRAHFGLTQVTILTDTSPPGTVSAIEANFWESRLVTAASPETEMYDGPDMLRFSAGIPFAPFNGVLRTRLTASQADGAIDSTLSYFRSLNLPMSWTVEPSANPDDLGERLTNKGLVFETDGGTGMALDLESLREEARLGAGVTIETVPTSEWLNDFVDVMAAGFGLARTFLHDFIAILADASTDQAGTQVAYLGRLNGKPVATSTLLLLGGVAGIYNVATLEEARGRGIGAAITQAALLEARKRGYRVAILESSAMGYSVYERLGFVEYCRLRHFVWTPTPPS